MPAENLRALFEYIVHVGDIVEIWAHVVIVEGFPLCREVGIFEILVQYVLQLPFHCILAK
jgi:hypothetical protein